MKKTLLLCHLLALNIVAASAQSLTYSTFMDSLRNRNMAFAAHQLNAEISQAEVMAAQAYDDPTLSIGYDNNSDWSIAMGQSVSAQITAAITPGKVAGRVAVAKQQLAVVQAQIADYWRHLKADASIDFYKAIWAKEMLDIELRTYETAAWLLAGDSMRYAQGAISDLEMVQMRLEEWRARQELHSVRSEYENMLLVLDEKMGNPVQCTRAVEGVLDVPHIVFDLPELLKKAFGGRPDLLAAEQEMELVNQTERLALKECRPDWELTLGTNYNNRVCNIEAPAPQFVGYSVALTIPLPVAKVNSGVRKAAKLKQQQADLEKESLRNSLYAEVRRAYNTFSSSQLKLKSFGNRLAEEAREILEGRMNAYRLGEISSADVLDAQHTYNEIRLGYASCWYDCMVAWVELQRSVGM